MCGYQRAGPDGRGHRRCKAKTPIAAERALILVFTYEILAISPNQVTQIVQCTERANTHG
jgi:hypothetical protein